MAAKLTTEDFINKAIQKHGDKYDYSKVVYVNYPTEVMLSCQEHRHTFLQTPANHLNGHGCRFCRYIKQSKTSCKQPYKDLTGKRINGLVVAWPVGYSGKKYTRANWLCFCDCGNSKIYNTMELGRRGARSMKSCGCVKRNEKSALTNLFAQYRYKAKERGFEWKLSLLEFESLVTSPCYYTGRLPQQLFTPKGYKDPSPPLAWNGVDRRDNTKGYTLDNCVPAWGIVNKMKLTMPEKEFVSICKEVAQHHN